MLVHDPADVVALTRRPEEAEVPAGTEVAGIDFENKETLKAALRHADRLFIAHGTSPQQVEHEIALIDSAVAAGIRHVVKLSTMGPATRLNPCAWHMEIEGHLARQPVASTVLRPSPFAPLLKLYAGAISTGWWSGAAGHGRVNFIDTRDVAQVARIALLDDVAPNIQRAYHLTGPRAWTMPQVAEELSRITGDRIAYEHCSPDERHAALIAVGVSSFLADLLVGLDQMFRDSALGETTSTVADLTGAAPRGLSEWIAENAGLFRKADGSSTPPAS
jgi:uncharacterized protein YbjT (DUF2867 family)